MPTRAGSSGFGCACPVTAKADTVRPGRARASFLVRYPAVTACLAGALAGFGQAPVSLPWLSLAALGVLCWLHLQAGRKGKAFRLGWAFGTGYFVCTLHWIVEPFFVDFARHAWMAPFALLGLASGLALFWGAAGALAKSVGQSSLAWALCLAVAELLRSYVLTGFPWALIGHVWIGWAPMQLAAWIGPHGLTFLTLLIPALCIAFAESRVRIAALLAGGAILYGVSAILAAQPVLGPDGPLIRLVQPNAPQHLKWHPDHIQGFFARQIQFTAAPADTRPDLIIWPETAVPALLNHAGPALEIIAEAAAGVPVVLGVQRREGADFFNSLVVLDETGEVESVYDKHHLVPFGEYIPAFGLLSMLPFGSFVEEHGFGYTPGEGPALLDLGSLGRALPLICYEAVFPQDVNGAPERPGLLLQITNDAWFGNLVGPYQHLAQARLRAVEQGVPMVRVANTGVSAVIDAKGNVTAALPLNEDGFLDARLPSLGKHTLYGYSGDWPASLGYALLFMALTIGLRRNRH